MTDNSSIKVIEKTESTALRDLAEIDSPTGLEQWRVHYIGRTGVLTQILRGLSGLSPEQRQTVGSAANDLKKRLNESLEHRQNELNSVQLSRKLITEKIDITLPGWPVARGRLHPITQTRRDIESSFTSMGFEIEEGPEVEFARYNFDLLNIPKEHPARDMWDTLWINRDGDENALLLRTHTSPMQARIMEKSTPPIRVIVPGKVYRYEATDATHEWHFQQVEGLAVDVGLSFADLKGTLYEFARHQFGSDRKIRFRCDYFPFVEPGVDMAIDCFKCDGHGCKICSGTGWIEIMGAGMVHPNVLRAVGYDPKIYTGFAFGMGIERICMLKHGIDDVRHFYANDIRFLEQF